MQQLVHFSPKITRFRHIPATVAHCAVLLFAVLVEDKPAGLKEPQRATEHNGILNPQ